MIQFETTRNYHGDGADTSANINLRFNENMKAFREQTDLSNLKTSDNKFRGKFHKSHEATRARVFAQENTGPYITGINYPG